MLNLTALEGALSNADHCSQIDQFVMHELYVLEKKTLDAYENFNTHSG